MGWLDNYMHNRSLKQCFSYLNYKDLSNTQLVCSRWRNISNKPFLWKNLCFHTFGEMKHMPVEGWKTYLKKEFIFMQSTFDLDRLPLHFYRETKELCLDQNIENPDFVPKLTAIGLKARGYDCTKSFVVNGILILVLRNKNMHYSFLLKNLESGAEVILKSPAMNTLECKQHDGKLFVLSENRVFALNCRLRIEDISLMKVWHFARPCTSLNVYKDTLVVLTHTSLELVDLKTGECKEIEGVVQPDSFFKAAHLLDKYAVVWTIYGAGIYDRAHRRRVKYCGMKNVHITADSKCYIYNTKKLWFFDQAAMQLNLIYTSKDTIRKILSTSEHIVILAEILGKGEFQLILFDQKTSECEIFKLKFTADVEQYGDSFLVLNGKQGKILFNMHTKQVVRYFDREYKLLDGRFMLREDNCLHVWDWSKPENEDAMKRRWRVENAHNLL